MIKDREFTLMASDRKAVYFLDDEKDFLKYLSRYLTHISVSCQTILFDTWQECKRKLEGIPPSLFFLDLSLPEKSGEEILGYLLQRWPRLPVIIISGNSKTEKVVTLIKAGAVDYITKPIKPETLEKALLDYLPPKSNTETLFSKAEIISLLSWKKELFTDIDTTSMVDSQKKLLKELQVMFNDVTHLPDLSQHQLAVKLNSNTVYLSRLIRQVWSMYFSEWYNRVRLATFISNYALPEYRLISLQGLAEISGFTSKSSFYALVKKMTGRTPKELIDIIEN